LVFHEVPCVSWLIFPVFRGSGFLARINRIGRIRYAFCEYAFLTRFTRFTRLNFKVQNHEAVPIFREVPYVPRLIFPVFRGSGFLARITGFAGFAGLKLGVGNSSLIRG
jgi:hypothetical protein